MAVIPLTQERPTQAYLPTLADRFSFGPWTVGNVGRGPFGDHTLGTNGVSLHDDDLVPFGTSSAERDGIVRRFRGALEASRCAPQERYRNEYLDQLVVELLLGIR